ncbi:hypothetical protein [Streptomyces sp. NPDC004285]
MRPLATRRLTALAISAALALGTAGPAFAGEHHPPTAAERAARTPLPDATAPPTLADAPDAPGSVNTSVTELVAAALTSGSGRPSAADVEAFKASALVKRGASANSVQDGVANASSTAG